MTERKPPGVSWESWFEEQIRQAQEEGAFENLPGAGKPLPDLEESYDPDWWVKKLIRREKVCYRRRSSCSARSSRSSRRSGRRAMKPRCGHGSTPSMPRSRR